MNHTRKNSSSITTRLKRRISILGCYAVLISSFPAALYSQESVADIGQAEVKSIVFNQAPASQVFGSLTNASGVSVTPLGKISNETITVIAKETTLEDTLNKITKPKGWRFWKSEDGRGYNVSDEAYYVQNVLPTQAITKIFRPDHVKADELESAISDLLTPGIGTVTPDTRTNKLIVSDLPEVIERIERLIREIDVQLFTRVFYIRHSDVGEVAEKIQSYKSEPGTIESDEKTHQIIVTDLLSNIKKMELLIDILDVGPEIVIYDVNNIGLEGDDLEDLQTIIEGIRTDSEDLLFEINEDQGVFILEDVPEVHERVEQILAGFDQPVKQVLIQGEIITTSFQRGFDFGIDRLAYSNDPIVDDLSSNGFTNIGDGVTDGETTTKATVIPPDGTDDDDDGGSQPFRVTQSFLALTGSTVSGGLLGSQAVLEYSLTFDDTQSKVLLQPRLLVKNQESSRIFVGREEPFLTTFFNDSGNNNNTTRSTSQSTVTDGLTFEITPSISNSYLVEMEIQIDNDDSEVVTRNSTDGQVDLIARDRQSIETVLTIPSGQTRVIGGLLTNSESTTEGGIPFLSTLPYIGGLFGSQSRANQKDNLQLFITPTIVEDILPRPTGEDGKRGRTVTGFERVPGNYGITSESSGGVEVSDDGPEELTAEELLSTSESAQDEIESLLRDTTPRDESEAEPES